MDLKYTKRPFKETKCVEGKKLNSLSKWIFHEPSMHQWWVRCYRLYQLCGYQMKICATSRLFFRSAHCRTYKQSLTHMVKDFDYFREILDSIFSLNLVNMTSARCKLYVDDTLLCKLKNCCRCASFL